MGLRSELVGWATAPVLPLWAAASTLNPRWRADAAERWGLAVPPVQPGCTWIVASSAGEVRAAAALADALEGPVLLTADTDSGARIARDLCTVAARKPVDHPWTLAPLFAEARPRRIVWVEGAWWPALAQMARSARVPTVRVNARRSRSSALRLSAGLEAPLVVTRSEADRDWFSVRGATAVVGGDLKLDGPVPPNPLSWRRPFAVAASTRPGDERWILEAGGTWLIAPRHLERLEEVEELLGDRPFVRRSRLEDGFVPDDVSVVLLDTHGELPGCFPGARAAFIGGTRDDRIGGHSPIEAWRAGVPVLCGPRTEAHREAFHACGATVVHSGHDLATALERDLPTPPAAPTGAARSTAAAIDEVCGACDELAPRPWARPLSWAHRAGRVGWHALWDRGIRIPARVGVPVVSIGSANARSPGRTPTVAWFCRELERRGFRPGVATRGYGRRRGGLACSWNDRTAAHLGDEGATLSASWPVCASVDRVEAASALVERGVDVVVLDDGLQHRHLHRDLDLVVVDGRFPRARGELPRGESREDPIPSRAHGVILHHGGRVHTQLPVVRAERVPGPWAPGPPVGSVYAFAGIGRPADFLDSLDDVAGFRALRDHEPISTDLALELLDWAGTRPLVCTEKDAARWPAELRSRIHWRSVQLVLHGVPEDWFTRLSTVR